ncbi:MAG: hypothetical protein JWQ27_2542 [Ferruginibacter sp.]|nr:hypothetical protein [Ferruginibacter sp.]
MEKVIAVVVTYNRQALLADCLTALRNQTRPLDAILVVNNGSTDHTASWLLSQKDCTVINQENTGSAGGFSTGIQWAYANGYTWTWCMDDDGYPKPDALENLLKAEDGTLRLLNCAVLDINDKKSMVWKTKDFTTGESIKDKIVDEVAHPFNGTLIHRNIIERVGVPSAKYFLWGDETEYLYRIISKNNIPARTVGNAIHYHPATRFSIKQDWDHFTAWKMYFYVRNRLPVLQAKANNRFLGICSYACFLVAFAGIILFFQKTDKLRKLKFMFWPAFHALEQNYSATPVLVLQQLNKTTSSLKDNTDAGIQQVNEGINRLFSFNHKRKAAGF